MARPRGIDDEDLVAAAETVLSTLGPSRFTLAAVATQAGVSASTLVKRFTSKRDLIVAIDRRWVASITPGLDDVVRRERTPLQKLRVVATWGFADLDDHERATNNLAALALDFQDPQMRALLAEGWGIVQARLGDLAQDAIDAGALPQAPPAAQVGRILFAVGEGTRTTWSVQPHGSLVTQAVTDIDAILSAWAGNAQR
ncbi:MAG: TetR/AcrR family transcriptional regulator [Nocardioidaceae bacterium]